MLVLAILPGGPAGAQDIDGPTNLFGSRGLMGTPNARMAPDGELAVGVADCDSKLTGKSDAFLASAPFDAVRALGVVEFAEAHRTLDAFLNDRGLAPGSIVFDRRGRVRPGHGQKLKGVARKLIAENETALTTLAAELAG